MSYGSMILIAVIIVFIMVVASNTRYFNVVNNLYRNFSKIPRLIVIVVAILSVLGLTNVIDPSILYKQGSLLKPQIKNIVPGLDDGKRLVSETTKKLVASKQHWTCGMCKKMLDETFEVDHVIPLYKGGSNEISNLMALDPICHRKKTNADRLNLATSVFMTS